MFSETIIEERAFGGFLWIEALGYESTRIRFYVLGDKKLEHITNDILNKDDLLALAETLIMKYYIGQKMKIGITPISDENVHAKVSRIK